MENLNGWIRDLERRGLSPATVVHHRKIVGAWLAQAPPNPTDEDLQQFLDRRIGRDAGRLSTRSRYRWLSTLHGYYSWAIRRGLATEDPTMSIDRPKLRKCLPRPIADDDLALALMLADPRMRAWLTLAAFAGLRCCEIARLHADDVHISDCLLRINGKGDKDRLVPLHPAVVDALRTYGISTRGPIFRGKKGRQVTADYVSDTINAFLRDIGVPATAHQCRHWFGTKTYQQSGDIRAVQELLGHACLSSTEIYTAWSRPAARNAVLGLEVPQSDTKR